MKRRRTGLKPFNTSSSPILFVFSCPRVISTLRSKGKSLVNNVEEVYKTNPTQIRPIGTNYIPSQKCIGIVLVAAWHSPLPLEVLRKESLIHTKEENLKMPLSMMLRILASSLFAYPKVESCEQSKNPSHRLDVMEVSYYIVCLCILTCVTTRIGLSLIKILS